MYKVILTRRGLKDWENIDEKIQDRIATKLKEYAQEPLTFARKLAHPKIIFTNDGNFAQESVSGCAMLRPVVFGGFQIRIKVRGHLPRST
ncbi:MAG TPA: hypothetical protein EYP63_08740 [Desulfotomaculum sp.]|nr:hypothetical protein [Desulfotomaculum sp.]